MQISPPAARAAQNSASAAKSANAGNLANLVKCAAGLIGKLREKGPRIHCITNTVAQSFTANAMLAVGALPSMTVSPGEVREFVSGADGLLINLGTLDEERRHAIAFAMEGAKIKNIGWVLDPVFVERSATRLSIARSIMNRKPTVLRLNKSEFTALADVAPTPENVAQMAQKYSCVVALTGAEDTISDGKRNVTVQNGHPLMAQVTGMGCVGSAMVAAALSVDADAFQATIGAMMVMGVAGELAGKDIKGPGSFAVAFLDTLTSLAPDTVRFHARVAG